MTTKVKVMKARKPAIKTGVISKEFLKEIRKEVTKPWNRWLKNIA